MNSYRLIQLIVALAMLSLLNACASTSTGKEEKAGVFKTVELADQAYAKGNWVEAEQYYHQVTQLAPNDFYAWFRLGNARLRQGSVESAIEALQAAALRDAEQAKSYYNLSIAYLLQSQQALRESYTRLPEHDPTKQLIRQKLELLKKIIYTQITDIPSPAAGLLEQ